MTLIFMHIAGADVPSCWKMLRIQRRYHTVLDSDWNVTAARVALLCSGSSDPSCSVAIRRKSTT